jgi:cytochrome c oxidase cbb3-type subunit III
MCANIKSHKMKKAVAVFWALMPFVLFAQDAAAPAAAPAAQAATGTTETIWYIIIGVMAVLLFAILILGNVLVNLVRVALEKSRSKAATLILLLLVSGSLVAEGTATPQPAGGSTLAANWTIIMAACVLISELFVVVVLLLKIRTIIIEISDKKEEAPAFEIHMPRLFDSFNASVPVEKERDILLDHNYDGIQELDNNLPPWWKYSFYLSIVFAIGYFSYYHVLGGPSSHDEYNAAVKLAQQQQEEYNRLNAGKVDENAVKMADAAGIDEGKTIFVTNCAPCHGPGGGGVVGPNLTDDYWLHGGSLTDIYKTIKNGWPAKGMKSWSSDLSPVQMKNVASYIKTLHGTNPPGAKAPQGDLYQAEGEKPVPNTTDSTKAQSSVDTSKAKGI